MIEECVERELVNLGKVEGISHPELFNKVAYEIAADTLEYVNQHDKMVVPRSSFYVKYRKRCIDIVVSSLALIITSHINLILAVCTFFDVGSPIIFKQERSGKNGKSFIIVKFRNMTNEMDENGTLLPPNQRVTKFGRFVRKTSLDELLNFWSVFKGDMSLIGPRPLPIEYDERYSKRHKMRYAVKPGLECPILHRVEHKITWADQFENDIYYVEHVSLLLDIKMIFGLVGMVFNKKGTAMRGNAVRGSFMGYNKDGSSINSQSVPPQYVEKAVKDMQN